MAQDTDERSISVHTINTDLASALMARGAKLQTWEPDASGQMRWSLTGVGPSWVDDFRAGRDGVQRVMHARRMLMKILNTDNRRIPNDRQS